MHIVAKPPSALLTFKVDAFRRECSNPPYKNVVSLGDGIAERMATLKLNGLDSPTKSAGSQGRRAKSVKLRDLPSLQQLVVEHELMQNRLADVVAFPGDLDLKAQFQ